MTMPTGLSDSAFVIPWNDCCDQSAPIAKSKTTCSTNDSAQACDDFCWRVGMDSTQLVICKNEQVEIMTNHERLGKADLPELFQSGPVR